MDKKHVRVYLAGPMTGCNEKQRTHWRKNLKRVLAKDGYSVSDPTDENARKSAYAVTSDIEQSDVVIANLWKESIGTVLGIVQARRSGIPVILIDQNYIDSPVLAEFADQIVRTEDAAVNALKEVCYSLGKKVFVQKKDKTLVEFSARKMGNSVRTALLQAGCDDSIFISSVLKDVNRKIARTAKKNEGPISSADIKQVIFEILAGSTAEKHSSNITAAVVLLGERWGDFELKKGDDAAYDALIAVVEDERLAKEMAELELENIRSIFEFSSERERSVAVSASTESAEEAVALDGPETLETFLFSTTLGRNHLVIRSTAKKSYKDLPYLNKERMSAALRLLRDHFLLSKTAPTGVDRLVAWDSFREGLRQERLTYGRSVTATGRGRSIEEHTVKTADGRTLPCMKIRDIGRTFDRQRFLCIYFAWDESENKLHIKSFDHGETQNDHT